MGDIVRSQRQTQIVDAAVRIIATCGARRFTVQALASEVGVTGGAIYRHFESMEAIADAIVERIGCLLFDGFPPQANDPIERLRLFFLKRATTIRAYPHVTRLLLSDQLEHACGGDYAERLQEFKRRTQRFIASCLAEAAEAQMLGPGVTPQVGAILVIGAVQGMTHSAGSPEADSQKAPTAEQVWSALERGLRGSTGSVPATTAKKSRSGGAQKTAKGARVCR